MTNLKLHSEGVRFLTSASWLRGSRTSFSICSSCCINSDARRFSASPHTSIIFLLTHALAQRDRGVLKSHRTPFSNLSLSHQHYYVRMWGLPIQCYHTSSWQNITTQRDDNLGHQLFLCSQSITKPGYCNVISSCPNPGAHGDLMTVK